MPLLVEYHNHFLEIQQKYGENSVVLMAVGSFYEMYSQKEEYLKKICNILNVLLTKKNKNKESDFKNPYMCGMPVHALSKHLSKLLLHNYTVAVYDQFDDPENPDKKIRKLVKIYSPSTYIEEELIENNSLCCISIESHISPIQRRKMYSGYFCTIDLATGRNYVSEYHDTRDNVTRVENEIIKNIYSENPCEILLLCNDDSFKKKIQIECKGKLLHHREMSKKYSDINFQKKFLTEIFGVDKFLNPIEKIGLERHGDLLVCYLNLLQFVFEHDPHIIKHIQVPKFNNDQSEMHLNTDCFFQLNLVKTNPNETSLFDIFNQTCTTMGKRLLHDRLTHPVTNSDELIRRYSLIEKSEIKRNRELLSNILDIEKKYRKLVLEKLNTRELAGLKKTFESVVETLQLNHQIYKIDTQVIIEMNDFYQDFLQSFRLEEMEKYDLNNIKSSFFKEDIFINIDVLNCKINNIEDIFENISEKLYNLGDRKAKVNIYKTEKEGIFLTTTKNCWNRISKNTNTKINFVYSGKKLKLEIKDLETRQNKNSVKVTHKLIRKLYDIQINKINKIQQEILKEYLNKLREYDRDYGDTFMEVVDIISEIDISVSTAYLSKKYAYVKPTILESKQSFINFEKIRHPIIEKIHDDKKYITNDVEFGGDTKGILLYGLNSSGKSSLLRSIGTNLLLAQAGLFVAASKFEYFPYLNLLTKISCADNLFKGQSTFIAEMQELKHILSKANNRSMVLCDELTSGTETNSATGIVASALQYLVKKDTSFLFTTHLHGITKFSEITEDSKISIQHFKIHFENGDLKYERKLRKGSGESTYGIEIANAIGLDREFIANAFHFRNKYEGKENDVVSNKRSKYNARKIVDKCEKCGEFKQLHTHHISHQKDADENGIISHFPKNIKHNLEILCEKCHHEEHKL
jgi:DNA mismatch repair protein MutS